MTHSKYTFDNIIENKNNSKILDDIINNNIIKNNPWLVDDLFFPKKKNDGITDILNSIFNIPTPKPKKKTTTITVELKTKKNTSILDMLDYILDKMQEKDDYDFVLPDGTPVKMYSDRIQVGFHTIPLFETNNFYNSLGNNTKKTIYEIYTII